jgi:hypothetical protein
MKVSGLKLCGHLLLVLSLAAAAGCSTLRYRSVQSEFEAAVRSDNERASMPFTEVSSAYQAVADQITPRYIAQLDPKLRPNAWTLRSVSLWRSGEAAAAISSSYEGLAEISRIKDSSPQIEHGRDSILLTMVPGLVEDSRLRQRLAQDGTNHLAAEYAEYAAKFKTAVRALAEAQAKASASTPVEVLHYWDYQCWRVLANWLYVIGKLPWDRLADANKEADAFVKTTLAGAGLADTATLAKAMDSAETSLPDGHPYRMLIALGRGR